MPTVFFVDSESRHNIAIRSIDTGGSNAAPRASDTITVAENLRLGHGDAPEAINLDGTSLLTVEGSTSPRGTPAEAIDSDASRHGCSVVSGNRAAENPVITQSRRCRARRRPAALSLQEPGNVEMIM